MPSGWNLERTVWLHHSQLWHSFCFDRLRRWQCVLDHIWLYMFYDLCNRIQRHRCGIELPGEWYVVSAVGLHYHQLRYTRSWYRICKRLW